MEVTNNLSIIIKIYSSVINSNFKSIMSENEQDHEKLNEEEIKVPNIPEELNDIDPDKNMNTEILNPTGSAIQATSSLQGKKRRCKEEFSGNYIICDWCSRQYMSQSSYSNHVKSKHREDALLAQLGKKRKNIDLNAGIEDKENKVSTQIRDTFDEFNVDDFLIFDDSLNKKAEEDSLQLTIQAKLNEVKFADESTQNLLPIPQIREIEVKKSKQRKPKAKKEEIIVKEELGIQTKVTQKEEIVMKDEVLSISQTQVSHKTPLNKKKCNSPKPSKEELPVVQDENSKENKSALKSGKKSTSTTKENTVNQREIEYIENPVYVTNDFERYIKDYLRVSRMHNEFCRDKQKKPQKPSDAREGLADESKDVTDHKEPTKEVTQPKSSRRREVKYNFSLSTDQLKDFDKSEFGLGEFDFPSDFFSRYINEMNRICPGFVKCRTTETKREASKKHFKEFHKTRMNPELTQKLLCFFISYMDLKYKTSLVLHCLFFADELEKFLLNQKELIIKDLPTVLNEFLFYLTEQSKFNGLNDCYKVIWIDISFHLYLFLYENNLTDLRIQYSSSV